MIDNCGLRWSLSRSQISTFDQGIHKTDSPTMLGEVHRSSVSKGQIVGARESQIEREKFRTRKIFRYDLNWVSEGRNGRKVPLERKKLDMQ